MEQHNHVDQVDTNGSSATRERGRLVVLRRTALLDSPPEPVFDRFTRLAARLLNTPAAIISLIDEHRQFFKSHLGLPEPWASRRETPLSHSFCQHLIASGEPLIIDDARAHPLSKGNPAIDDLGVVAYLAMPLCTATGHLLGGLCVIDHQPRSWTPSEIAMLEDLAAAVTAEIDLRLARREAEEQAREAMRQRDELAVAQASITTILDSIGDGFFVLDREWRFAAVNQGVERLLGRGREDLLGRCIWEAFPELVGTIFYDNYRRAVAERVALQFEAFYPPLGRWYSVHACPIANGLSVMYQDITAYKQAEAATRFLADMTAALGASLDYDANLTQLAQLTVPTLADLCVVNIVEEDGSLRRVAVASVNPERTAAVRTLDAHYPLDPQVSTGVGQVIRTGQALFLPEVPDALLQRTARDARHLALLRQIGLASYMIVPLRSHNQTLGVIALAITESARRYTPADLALAEELGRRAALAVENARLYKEARQAARQREEFLSIASHELRTPLTTVKAGVQLLARYSSKPKWQESRTRRLLQQIQDQLRRLEILTNDLLDASRIQQGQLELRLAETDLSALTRQVVGRFEQEIEQSPRHRLVVETPEPVVGQWDQSRLDQVLTNLLSNAIKYSPDGGEIRVRVRRDGDWAELSVSDEGIGIPDDEQKLLFRPFARSVTVHQRIGGVGLGLYITARIAERHGGSVSLQSKPNAGSTFTVRLPLKPSA